MNTSAAACRAIGLNTIDISERAAQPSTRRRQELWCMLCPSARLCFWGWTSRQPQGWWSLVDHVAARANVRHLTFRDAIQPLIDIGWANHCPNPGSSEVWLTRDGRNARAALQRALRKASCQ